MADEESFLGLAETGTDNREETGDGVEENGTATSGVKVERVRKPTTTMGGNINEGVVGRTVRSNVPQSGDVHQTDEPRGEYQTW